MSPWVLNIISFSLMTLVTIPALFLAATAFLGADSYLGKRYGETSNEKKLYGFVAWIGGILIYLVVLGVLLQPSFTGQFFCSTL